MGQAILENIQDLADVGTPEFRYQMEELSLFKRTAIEDSCARPRSTWARASSPTPRQGQRGGFLKPGDAKVAQSLPGSRSSPRCSIPRCRLLHRAGAGRHLRRRAQVPGAARTRTPWTTWPTPRDLTPATAIEALIKAVETKSGLSAAAAPVAPAFGLALSRRRGAGRGGSRPWPRPPRPWPCPPARRVSVAAAAARRPRRP